MQYKLNEEDVAMELEVALKDFYNGEIVVEGKTVNLKFPNGQNFKIVVVEEK